MFFCFFFRGFGTKKKGGNIRSGPSKVRAAAVNCARYDDDETQGTEIVSLDLIGRRRRRLRLDWPAPTPQPRPPPPDAVRFISGAVESSFGRRLSLKKQKKTKIKPKRREFISCRRPPPPSENPLGKKKEKGDALFVFRFFFFFAFTFPSKRPSRASMR